MLGSQLNKAGYAILLLRIGGPLPLLLQLKRQLYSRAIFLGLKKDLHLIHPGIRCEVDYTLQLASEDDIEEMLRGARRESSRSSYELVQRKWFYDSGFRNCYMARAVHTGELCYMQWMISMTDSPILSGRLSGRFPSLGQHEVLLENAYTFERYRGKRLMPSVQLRLAEIAREKGLTRMVTYVREDNIPSLKGCERAGFRVFEQASEFKLLFCGGRRHP
jgi:RimJ/RimL family protein N-acetyltransferase